MKIFATTAASLAAVFMAVASAAESGVRNLQTDCNDISEFKLYEPGMCAVAPVRTPGAPCFLIQRLREGQCLSTSKVDSYNFMMSTKNPTGGCGTTQPACGRLKLFSTSTGKVIRRQVEFSTYWILPALGAECFGASAYSRSLYLFFLVFARTLASLVWPYMLFGDTPCNPDGTTDSDCNPSAFMYNSTAPLPPGSYYIKGETFSDCTVRGSPTGLLDTKLVNFRVAAGC
jgi:hypothetical protein